VLFWPSWVVRGNLNPLFYWGLKKIFADGGTAFLEPGHVF
jgi:hypothetical protein